MPMPFGQKHLLGSFFLILFLPAYTQAQNQEQEGWLLYKQSLSKSIPFQSTVMACEKALIIAEEIRHDKLRLKTKIQLGIIFWNDGQFAKAENHLQDAQTLASVLEDSLTQACSIHYQGLSAYYTCRFDSAILLYNQAEYLYHLKKLDSAVAKIKSHKGLIYHAKANYSEAVKNMMESFLLQEKTPGYRDFSVPLQFSTESDQHHYFENKLRKDWESLEYLKDTKDLDKLAFTLTNVGKDYHYQKRFVEAIHYLKRGIDIQKQLGQLPFTGDLAAAYAGLGKYDSAEFWYKSRLADVKRSGTQIHLSAVYQDLGLLYSNQKNWNEALHYFTLALELTTKLGLLRSKSFCNKQRALSLAALNLPNEALFEIESAIKIAKKIGCLRDLQEFFMLKGTILQTLQCYPQAVQALQRSRSISDSIANGESSLQIARLQIEYDTDKKTRDLGILQIRNSLNEVEIANKNLLLLMGLCLALVMFTAGAFLLFRYRQKIKESNLLKLNTQLANEQIRLRETMLSEIHHRVKNNLQIIASLINLKSSQVSAEASEILQQLNGRVFSMGLVHEKLYKTDALQFVRLDTYLVELCHYLIDSFSTFEKGIALAFNVEPIELDADKTLNCGLICNELITNSLKHAFGPDQQNRVIRITLLSKLNQVELSIQDNGQNTKTIVTANTQSFGLRFVDQLVRSKLNGDWTTTSDNGMNTKITFPNA
jgi:two-component system, sensor histidine kinase PdtaS